MVNRWQEISKTITQYFRICPFNGQKMQEKVSKSYNADKNGLGEYLTINLDTFCQSTTHFDGAVIFWTLLDQLDQCA